MPSTHTSLFSFLKGLGLYVSLLSNKTKLEQSQNELTELYYKLGKQALADNLPIPEFLGVNTTEFKNEFEKVDRDYINTKEQKANEIHHFREEIKNIENEMRMLNRELLIFKRDQNELRHRLKKRVAILNYKSNLEKKQKKQFTVLTLFKGKIDANKTLLQLKDEVGELNQMIANLKEGIVEHTESLARAKEKHRKCHLQHEYSMNTLKKDIKSKEKNYLEHKNQLKSTLMEIGKFNATALETVIPNCEHIQIIHEQMSIYNTNITSIQNSLSGTRGIRFKGLLQCLIGVSLIGATLYFLL